ncbi:hypothetical protein HYW42_03740 [Candidatus Daviesbacteria bacterium]|nr:hypothetical protein [Candidatus Daviesbacteria bacterium]
MADGSSGGFKQFAGEMGETVKEVVKDTSGSFQDMGQQAAESFTGNYQNPQKQAQQQQAQQQKIDEQKRLNWARTVIEHHKKLASQIRYVREQKEQQWTKRQQEEQQKKEKERAEQAQRNQVISSPSASRKGPGVPGKPAKQMREDLARSQAELRAGRGQGG